MVSPNINILLADDGRDDYLFFKEALEALPLRTTHAGDHDGEQLMQLLPKKSDEHFHVFFPDINIPRKNGITRIKEITHNKKLKHHPLIIFTTSNDQSIAGLLYENGAQHYICKSAVFSEVKKVIQKAITFVLGKNISQPRKENFLVNNLGAIIL